MELDADMRYLEEGDEPAEDPRVELNEGVREANILQGEVVFNSGRMGRLVFYHLAWPFSLVVLLPYEGLTLALNLRLLPTLSSLTATGGWLVGTVIPAAVLMIQITVLILFPFTHAMVDPWLCISLLVSHRFIVGTKYGLMPDDEYLAMLTTILPARDVGMLNITRAWREPSAERCTHELRKSQQRLGIPHLYMLFPPSELVKLKRKNHANVPSFEPEKAPDASSDADISGWALRNRVESTSSSVQLGVRSDATTTSSLDTTAPGTLPGTHTTVQEEEMELTCAFRLTHHFIQEIIAGNCSIHAINPGAMIVSFILISLPALSRFLIAQDEHGFGDAPPGQEWVGYLVTFVGYIGVMFPASGLASFVTIGKIDYFRRYATLRLMNFLIDPQPIPRSALAAIGYREEPLALDMTIPRNIASWLSMRELLIDFGSVYQTRAAFYTTYTFVAITIILVRTIYVIVAFPQEIWSSSNVQFLTVVMFLTSFMIFQATFMTWFGHKANLQSRDAIHCLRRLDMNLQDIIAMAEQHETQLLEEAELCEEEAQKLMTKLQTKVGRLERRVRKTVGAGVLDQEKNEPHTNPLAAMTPTSVSGGSRTGAVDTGKLPTASSLSSLLSDSSQPGSPSAPQGNLKNRAHARLEVLTGGQAHAEIPVARLRRAVTMLDLAARAIEANDKARPVNILGIRVEITLLTRLLAGSGGAIGFILSRVITAS